MNRVDLQLKFFKDKISSYCSPPQKQNTYNSYNTSTFAQSIPKIKAKKK